MQFQSYLAENTMGHPQRRRMFNLMDRHNLKSKVDIAWMQSLQNPQLKQSKVIQSKRNEGINKVVQKYNTYVDKQLESLFKGDKYASISFADGSSLSSSLKRVEKQLQVDNNEVRQKNSRQLYGKQRQNLDKSLNLQLEHFNEKTDLRRSYTNSVENENSRIRAQRQNSRKNSYDYHKYGQQKYTLSPKFLKQMILRSALDKPEVYGQLDSDSKTIFRNFKPDNLQSYLRINQKRTYR